MSISRKRLAVSVGIFAYNEEHNILNALEAMCTQVTNNCDIGEIIVVSSGSTDGTDELVEEFAANHERVSLIVEPERRGKIRAINLFLDVAEGEVVVIQSADVIAEADTIETLCAPFILDERVGMTSGNPIPVNDPNTFLGYIIHFWWFAHNRLPRHGEIIAFRNILPALDPDDILDEACAESLMVSKGYSCKHCGDAIVHNRGAGTIRDLIKQRRRNYFGHARILRRKNYPVSSLFWIGRLKILRLVWEYYRQAPSVRHALWLLMGACIEIYSQILGGLDVLAGEKGHGVWDIAKSTKKGIKVESARSAFS